MNMVMPEGYMGNRGAIVATFCGHGRNIDKFSVSSFEISENTNPDDGESGAKKYCDAINSLELKDDAWIFAKILSENTQYTLDELLPLKFSDVIIKMDNGAVQKVLRETDSLELVKSLKDQDDTVKEKIFKNLSERASQMLREDMEYMGPVSRKVVKKSQEKILAIVRHLEQIGEIVVII
jgi:flagellar motor switch protein FliG